MPNWCQNVIYVSHEDKNKMMALKDAILNHELCDHIMPMPEELKGTTSPSDSPNWYDWACEHWGTKWDICSSHDTDEIYSADDGETYVFKFDTNDNEKRLSCFGCSLFIVACVSFVSK